MDRRRCGIGLTWVIVSACVTHFTRAQSDTRPLPFAAMPAEVDPLLDDAGLHDVQWMGSRRAWTVGDRGVVWRTADAGESWLLCATPVNGPLYSVCFLTDRVGWVAGGRISPHLRTASGILLTTTDGGATWQDLSTPRLPLLRYVQFFDLQQGIAVGDSTSEFPTGVLRTNDGGKTWEPVRGPAAEGWRCGSFLDPNAGVVARSPGSFQSVGGGRLLPALIAPSGLRGMQDIVIRPDLTGWLVGDGGLVMTTDSAGVSWRSPPQSLPRELRDVQDFRGVASQGEHVWIVGQPGSVIWHSPDAGETWVPQATGHPTPLYAVAFASADQGCAVGACGRILVTQNGGDTWEAARQPAPRLALLSFHAHPSRISLNTVTQYGGELGYRTAACLIARRDIGPERTGQHLLDEQMHQAITLVGGTSGEVDWSFPLAAPELSFNLSELVREWQLLTDNRLREVMLTRLVATIRTWRPEVVLIESPPADDAATKLLSDALALALREAGDAGQHTELTSLLQLEPWQPRRVFRCLPQGSESLVTVNPYEFLPRLGSSLLMASADAYASLPDENVTAGQREAYELVGELSSTSSETSAVRDFFAGLTLPPGGDARRLLRRIDDDQLERRQNLAQQQRNFAEYSQRNLDDSRNAGHVIAQLQDITGTAPADQAALQLVALAGEFRRRGEWDLAEGVLSEVVRRYPQAAATIEARHWLLHFYSSDEVAWQRLRKASVGERSTLSTDRQVMTARLEQALEQVRSGEEAPATSAEDIITQASATSPLRLGGAADQHEARRASWLEQADAMVKLIEETSPGSSGRPSTQFTMASLQRRLGRPRQSDDIFRNFMTAEAGGPWNRLAAGELWLTTPEVSDTPHPTIVCRRVSKPPILDGILGDECWSDVDPVVLQSESEASSMSRLSPAASSGSHASVQFACDARFLYVAANMPRIASLPADTPQMAGRTDDADLRGFDRLSFQFDIDRDYATSYRFDVDQRGWSADACWENETWNAQRYIAVDADENAWRIEMAIPFRELVPATPSRGETWGAAIVRILPAVGIESWTHPSGTRPLPEGFGFIRFE